MDKEKLKQAKEIEKAIVVIEGTIKLFESSPTPYEYIFGLSKLPNHSDFYIELIGRDEYWDVCLDARNSMIQKLTKRKEELQKEFDSL